MDKIYDDMVEDLDFLPERDAERIARLFAYTTSEKDLPNDELRRWNEIGILKGRERRIILNAELWDGIQDKKRDNALQVSFVLLALMYDGKVKFTDKGKIVSTEIEDGTN